MPEGFPLPFALLLAFLAVQRLFEVAWSRHNLKRYSAQARDAESPGAFTQMVLLHAALVLLPALEVALRGHSAPPALMWGSIVVFALAQVIRYWAIHSLGRSWNQQAIVDPAQPVVSRGPYRFIRHPNYLAILLEFLAVPAAGGAWIALIVLNLLHAPVIVRRISAEERLLAEWPGYQQSMAGKGRLLPTFGTWVAKPRR